MKNPPIAQLVVIALAGVAAGYVAYRQVGRHVAAGAVLAAQAPAASASRTPASPEDEPTAPTIPALVPDLRLTDLAGKRQALRETDGRARLFNFWATWCEPCRREIPLLNALQHQYGAEGLQVVGIAVDMRDAVQKFLKTTPMHYSLLVGEEDGLEAAQKFGMEMLLPFSVFADEHNRIVAVKVGELHRDEADVIMANMRQLKAGRETLAEAQAAIAQTLKKLSLSRAKQSAPR